MTILTRERFFTAPLHVRQGDARQAKAGLLRRDGNRFIAIYDPERASLGTAVVLARALLSSEGTTVSEVILEGHDPDLTALYRAASKLLLVGLRYVFRLSLFGGMLGVWTHMKWAGPG